MMNIEEKMKIAKEFFKKHKLTDPEIDSLRQEDISADYFGIPNTRGYGGLLIADDGSYLFCQSAQGLEYWKEEFKKGERSINYEKAQFIIRIDEGNHKPGHQWSKFIVICDNVILKSIDNNKEKKEDVDISNNARQLVLSEIDKIKEFDNMIKNNQVQTRKDSSRANLNIKIDNVNYYISGKVDNKEISDFYKKFTSNITQMVDKTIDF